mmetsp:Transcript_1552/g.2689  ORF Transcript_1552/g.2689 Transcript_1552/m.2689 type:complete len:240 (-) Transcript_1552:783-1502(-)
MEAIPRVMPEIQRSSGSSCVSLPPFHCLSIALNSAQVEQRSESRHSRVVTDLTLLLDLPQFQNLRFFEHQSTMPFYLQALMLATATSLLSVPLAASETLNDIDCIRNLTKIFEQEQSISDLSIEREYILCPSTNFDIGHVQLFGDGAIVGQFPLVLRPNLHARCGHDGSRSNNCTLTGGTFGVFSTVDLEGQVDLGHVVLKGLTFQSLDVHAIIIGGQHGMVDVIDCAFLVSAWYGTLR